ncbi:MAG: methyl-accepting chemotaxis protein [Microcoleaceae cyanobacterium]
MNNQPFWTALLSGGITAIATAIVTIVTPATFLSKTQQNYIIASVAGITSFLATFSLGVIATQQLRSSTNQLGDYLEAISEGNYNVRTPIYHQDRLLYLSKKFNHMADVICNILINIKIQEEKSIQDKEKIASQVIQLLDKVDAAAHGTLNVKVKVRCEELGVISYCINMTIDNFRKLVKQVDLASQEIDGLATDSQSFFQSLSLESQCQAEEITSFFTSLQVIVDSYYQRAYKAWEAEKIEREINSYATTSCEAINQIFDEIIASHILILEITHKVQRFYKYNYDLIKIMDLVSQINCQSKILGVNSAIYATKKTSNEDILKIATELKYLANNWELVQKKIEHFQRNIQGLNLTIPEHNIVEEKPQSKKYGEEVKRGLTKIIQKVYKFNNYMDNIASLGENQTNNLQQLTEILQILHKKSLEKAEATKQVRDSLDKMLNIQESLLESVKMFNLDKTE